MAKTTILSSDGKKVDIDYSVELSGDEGQKHCRICKVRSSEKVEKLSIPEEIANYRVKEIYFGAFENVKCAELHLPDNITLEGYSFYGAKIGMLIIPKVKNIPTSCFDGSEIGILKFSYPEESIRIERGAFSLFTVTEICWPTGASIIPRECFFGSYMEKLTGIERVKEVGPEAFANVKKLKKLYWPSNCNIIPDCCFRNARLEELNCTFIEHIREQAFKDAVLKELRVCCSSIGPNAFKDSYLESIYISGKEIKIDEYSFCGTAGARINIDCDRLQVYYLNLNEDLKLLGNLNLGFDTEIEFIGVTF